MIFNKKLTKKKSFKELFRFFVIGAISVFIDFLFYTIFSLFLPLILSKSIGFILGSLFSLIGNKYWTFRRLETDKKQFISFYFVYFINLTINVKINSIFLRILFNYRENYVFIAFLIATFVSASLNFLGLKFIVFFKKQNQI